MLGLIVESYKEVFYEDYTYVEMGISPDWSECDKQEYMEIGSFFDKECQKLHRFLNTNAKENGTFRSELTGETFTSLRQKVDNFTSIDLEKYDSYGFAERPLQKPGTLHQQAGIPELSEEHQLPETHG